MTAPGQVLRRLFISVGEALRPHRWAVLFLAVLTELVVLASLGLAHGEDAALAVAVSFMVLAAVAAGTLAGPSVGAAAALVGGAIFYATVAHFGTDQSFLATAASTAIWRSRFRRQLGRPMWRTMFSTTTIASSTRMPMEKISANSVMRLRV